MQHFANNTSMHGINELYYAKSKFWITFWAVILIVAFGITGYQVYQALLQYMDSRSVTVIKPAKSDQILYPPLQLCYLHWMYWVDWQKAKLLNFNKPAILYGLSFVTAGFSSQKFDIEEARKDFFKTFQSHNMSTLSEFYSSISMDLDIGKNSINSSLFNEKKLIFKYPNILYCYVLSAEKLHEFLQYKEKEPTSFTFGLELLMSVTLKSYANLAEHLTYEEYNHQVAFWLMINYEYKASIEVMKENFTDSTLPPLLFPNAYDSREIRLTSQNNNYMITFRVTAHHWENSPEKPCKAGDRSVLPDDKCFMNCHVDYFAKRCKCLFTDNAAYLGTDYPASLCPETIHFLPLADSATVKDTNETLEELFRRNQDCDVKYPGWIDNDKICIHRCIPACETWSYDMHLSTSVAMQFGNIVTNSKNRMDIWIRYPFTGDILVLTETDPRTWEDFVGNVGGLLGIWTGASIISFIQMIYLCCCADSEIACRVGRKKITYPQTIKTRKIQKQ